MVDEFHAVRFLEKKRTNSGPFMESTSKHSIYPHDLILLIYADYMRLRRERKAAGLDLCSMAQAGQPVRLDWSPEVFSDAQLLQQVAQRRPADRGYRIASVWQSKKGNWLRPRTHSLSLFTVSARCRMQHGNRIFPNPGCRAVRQPCHSNWRHAKAGPGVPPRVCHSGPGAIGTPAPSQQPERHEAGRGMREPAAHREDR